MGRGPIHSQQRALEVVHQRSDEGFFADHPDRHARIRRAYKGECEGEFWSLGDHPRERRRIVLWRVSELNPAFEELKKRHGGIPLLKIPFLVFSDETVEDRDDVLLSIVHTLMTEAAARMQ